MKIWEFFIKKNKLVIRGMIKGDNYEIKEVRSKLFLEMEFKINMVKELEFWVWGWFYRR